MKKVLFVIFFLLGYYITLAQDIHQRNVVADSVNARSILVRDSLKATNVLTGATTYFLMYNPTTKLFQKMDTAGWGGGAGVVGDDLGDHIMTENLHTDGNYISGDGGNEGISIDGSGSVTFSGATTHSGNATFSAEMISTAISNGYPDSVVMITGDGTFVYARLSNFAPDTNVYYDTLWVADNDSISIGTDAFKSNWRLGIGTDSPVSKLDIYGDLHIKDTLIIDSLPTGLAAHIMMWDSATNTVWKLDTSWISTFSPPGDTLGNHMMTENLQTLNNWISNDGDNEGIFIADDGTVTINYPSDVNYDFLVSGNSRFGAGATDTTWFGAYFNIQTDGTTIWLSGDNRVVGYTKTAPAYSLYANSLGVGVGTNTISKKLTVNGGVYASSSSVYLDTITIYGPLVAEDSIFFPNITENDTATMIAVVDTADGQVYYIPADSLETRGDNLGNHIATENIQLNKFYLSDDGDNEGILISTTGVSTLNAAIIEDSLSAAGLRYPQVDGDNLDVLATDGSGNLYWADPATPASPLYIYSGFEGTGSQINLTKDTWTFVTNGTNNLWTAKYQSGCTLSNDTIYVGSTAMYDITGWLTLSGVRSEASGKDTILSIIRSNTLDTYYTGCVLDSNEYIETVNTCGLFDLDSGDYVIFQVANTSDDSDIQVISGSIVVKEIP